MMPLLLIDTWKLMARSMMAFFEYPTHRLSYPVVVTFKQMSRIMKRQMPVYQTFQCVRVSQ